MSSILPRGEIIKIKFFLSFLMNIYSVTQEKGELFLVWLAQNVLA